MADTIPRHLTDLNAGIAECYEVMEDPDLRDALISLIRDGLVVDSGRRRNGRIVWVASCNLTNN
jgi:hypothetical protein